MTTSQRVAAAVLAAGLVGLGALMVIYRDFAYSWQPVPAFPGRDLLAIVCGLLLIAAAVALLSGSTMPLAARVLFVLLFIWLCLKVPALIVAPQIEGVWLGFGEIAMLFAGGWVLFACFSGLNSSPVLGRITGPSGVRLARILFGAALLPVGLSHLIYPEITAGLVPSWLPFRTALAYLTGVGQMACGAAVLFSLWPRAAAFVETGMLTLFAFLVWGPHTWLASAPKGPGMPPGPRFPFTAFLITWVIGSSALLVAVAYEKKKGSPRLGSRSHFGAERL